MCIQRKLEDQHIHSHYFKLTRRLRWAGQSHEVKGGRPSHLQF